MGKKGKRKSERDKEKPAVYIEPESRGLSLYDVKRKLQTTQRQVQKKDFKKMFASPITDTAAPGYSQIIAKPMDFYTINKKISSESYAVFRDYMADVGLVLQNCMTYNMGDTPYYKYAAKLAPVFEKIFEKELGIKFTISLPPPRSEPILLRDIIPGYESSEDDENLNGEQESNNGEEEEEENIIEETVSESQSGHVSSEELLKEEVQMPNCENFDTPVNNEPGYYQSPQQHSHSDEHDQAPVSTEAEASTVTELQHTDEKLVVEQNSICNDIEEKKISNALPQNQPGPTPRVLGILDVSLPLEVDTEQNSDRISVASDVSKTSGFSLASNSLQTPSTPTKQRKPFKRKKKSDMYEFVDEDLPEKPFNDIPGKSKLSIEDILNMSSETCGDNEYASLNSEASAGVDKPCSPIQFSDNEENVTITSGSNTTESVAIRQDNQLEETTPVILEKEISESNSQPGITSAEVCSEAAIEITAATNKLMPDSINSNNSDMSREQLHVCTNLASECRGSSQIEPISNLAPVSVKKSSMEAANIQTEETVTEVAESLNSIPISNADSQIPNCLDPVPTANEKHHEDLMQKERPEASSEQANQSPATSPGVIKKRRGRPKLDRSKITGGCNQSRTPPASPAVLDKIKVFAEEVVTMNVASEETIQLPVESIQNSTCDPIAQPPPKLDRLPSVAENFSQELQIDESQTAISGIESSEPVQMEVTPSSPQFIQFSESLDNHFCDSETPLIIDQSTCDRSTVGIKNPFNDNVLELPLAQIDSSETLAAVAAISADESEENTANLGVSSANFNTPMESCSEPLEVMTHLMPQLAPPVTSQTNTSYVPAQGQQNLIDSIEHVQPFNEELNTSAPGSAIVSSSLSDLAALLVSPQTTNVSGSKNTSLNSLECSFGFGLSPSTLSLTPSTNVSLNFETSPTKMFDDLICCIDTPQKFTPPVSSNLPAMPVEAPVPINEQQPQHLVHQEILDKTSLKRPANPTDNDEPAPKVAKESHFPSQNHPTEFEEGYINTYREQGPLIEHDVSDSLPFDKLVETPLAGSYELPLGYLKNGGIQKEVRFLPVTPSLDNNIVLSKDCFITRCDIDEDICKLKTYSYLSYGSHGHYAPDKEVCEEPYTLPSEKDILHSVYSGPVGLQFAESLQKFTAQMNPYMKRVVDDFLNSLTDEKHSLYQNKQLLSLPMEDSDKLSITQKEIKQLRTLKKLGIDISFLDETKEGTDRPKINENHNQAKQSLPKVQAVSSLHLENSQQGSFGDPEPLSVNTTITPSELSFEPNSDSLSNIIPTMSVSSNSNVSPKVMPSFTDSNVSNTAPCNYQQPATSNNPNLQYTVYVSGHENQDQHFYDNLNRVAHYGQHAAPTVSLTGESIVESSTTTYTTNNHLNVSSCKPNMSYISSPTQNVTMNTSNYMMSQASKLQHSQIKPQTTTAPLIKLPPISQFNESLSRSKGDRFDFGRNQKMKESPNVVQNLAVERDRLERPKSATCIAPASDFRSNELYIHNPRSAPNIGDRNNFSSFSGSLQNDTQKEIVSDEKNCRTSYGGNYQPTLLDNNGSNISNKNSAAAFMQNVPNCNTSYSNDNPATQNSNVSSQMPTSCATPANTNPSFYSNSADVSSVYNSVYENSIPASNELPPNQISTNHQSAHSQQRVCNGYTNEYTSSSYGYPSHHENAPSSTALEGAGHPAVQPISVFFENPQTTVSTTVAGPSSATFDGLSTVLKTCSGDDVTSSKHLIQSTWEAQPPSVTDTSSDLQSQETLNSDTTSSEQSFMSSTDVNTVNL